MGQHEPSLGASDEWYTPAFVFEALGVRFDLDVAAPKIADHAALDYCDLSYTEASLERPWAGFLWMNPPFSGRNGLVPWLDKFFAHGDGVALTPDRTSTDWWQDASLRASAHLQVRKKIKFYRPDGSVGRQPGNGTTLWAAGPKGVLALERAAANGLGSMFVRVPI